MPYKLSPSSLSLMADCKRCFWLDKHKVWKRPQGIFPSLPSGMDKILKEHFDRFSQQNKLPPELHKANHDEKMKLFNDAVLLKQWRNNLKGIRYQDAAGNLLFGAIDNLLVKGNKLIVLDFKTRGFPLKEDTASSYQTQLNLYNFLLRKNNYQTEDFAYLLFYVPEKVLETGEVIFTTELVKMDIDVEQAERLFTAAIQLLEEDCPEERCGWCGNIAINAQ